MESGLAVQCFAPTDLYHVMVETPIPAGVEPVDPNLAATSPELTPIDPAQDGWGVWTPSFTDYRDDKVTIFAIYLPAGAYAYTFLVRAALSGEFRVLPVHGEMMYFPEVWGRSAGALFTVRR